MADDARTARSTRLLEIVTEALERSPDERDAFLDTACGDDDALRAEAVSLVSLDEPARDFIARPAIEAHAAAFLDAAPATALQPGQTLGEFHVRSLLGVGGMGEVYLAEDTRLGRLVAIKLVRTGVASPTLLSRFEQEKRILAGLNDPHIARLYGGAVTPEGLPYLVIEYVEGERLDDYCDKHRLSVAERLVLFRKVCSAVAYAHQNLVIHRDLKPANIRVTPQGEPKLLDFGVAKLLDADATRNADLTVTMFAALTPEYASPEQIKGEPITTASDVYSLGVVLYELLTGQKPYRLDSHQPVEMARVVCEQEPERPSTVASRGTATRSPEFSPGKLRRRLRDDLDNVVTMAMRKEPARRYISVSQFSDDLGRHLNGLPVMARRDTLGYRAGKFMRRNKAGMAAAALAVLALVVGLAVALWQAQRANRRFEDVRRLAHSILFDMEPQMAKLAGSTEVRSTLVKSALEYLDSLAREAGGNRELQRELATAYEKVGDVQGNPEHSNLGDLKGGLVSFRKAQAIRQAMVKSDPGDALARHELAGNYEQIGGILWWSDQTDGALANYRDALALRRPLLAAQPRSVEFRQGFGSLQMCIGDVLNWNGRSIEALADFREALPVLQSLAAEHPGDAAKQIGIARCLVRIGAAQKDTGDYVGAADTYSQAERVVLPLLQKDPNSHAAVMEEWLILWRECESFNEQKSPDKALEIAPRMLALIEAIAQKDSKNAQIQHDLANSYNYHGRSLALAQRWQEAADEDQKSLDIDGRLADASPENGEYAHSRGSTRVDLGDALIHLGQIEAALADEQAAQALLETAAAKDPSNLAPRRDLVDVFMARGTICDRQQHPADARQWYQRALAALEEVTAKKYTNKADPETFATLRAKLVQSASGDTPGPGTR